MKTLPTELYQDVSCCTVPSGQYLLQICGCLTEQVENILIFSLFFYVPVEKHALFVWYTIVSMSLVRYVRQGSVPVPLNVANRRRYRFCTAHQKTSTIRTKRSQWVTMFLSLGATVDQYEPNGATNRKLYPYRLCSQQETVALSRYVTNRKYVDTTWKDKQGTVSMACNMGNLVHTM